MAPSYVVLDTNVFVAAGFNADSSSARLIEAIRRGELTLVWNEATRGENRDVVEQIPPLSWESLVDLFTEAGHYTASLAPEKYGSIPDPADRKFVALAAATGAAVVSHDDDLLANRTQADVRILTPEEFFEGRAGE